MLRKWRISAGDIVSRHPRLVAGCIPTYTPNIAIAFQFSRIGNDESAKHFLEELDQSEACGKYVNVSTGTFSLRCPINWSVSASDGNLGEIVGLGFNEILKSKSPKRRELVCHEVQGLRP